MSTLLIVKIVGLLVGAVASVRAARKDSAAGDDKRLATILVTLGFGTALVAELVDASQKQSDAADAMRRNNVLLAEVQRTLHPLFPLSVDVRFVAPLNDQVSKTFRASLENMYQREHSHQPDIPIVSLHFGDPIFPSCKKDPIAFQVVSAHLGSVVRLYSRQHTKIGQFDRPDVEFCPCPILRDVPSGKGLILGSDEERRRMTDMREYEFNVEHGLYMHDGGRRIDFIDTKNTTDMVSVDDLLGATLEIATQAIDPSDQYCQPSLAADRESITFATVAVILPGWRRIVVQRQRFKQTPASESTDWLRYRFTIPETRDEFEKLVWEEKFWATPDGGPR